MSDDLNLKPPPPIAPDTWTHLSIVRTGATTTVHTTEQVDGVLFLAKILYDKDGRMAQKSMIRADLVAGGRQ